MEPLQGKQEGEAPKETPEELRARVEAEEDEYFEQML